MISIVIPAYEQRGHGARLITELLQSIQRQKVTCDHEVIVSDSANDDSIKNAVSAFPFVNYRVNPDPVAAAQNINYALSLAKHTKVKLMCQDDLFLTTDAIDKFNDALDISGWVISNSITINGNGVQMKKHNARYIHNFYRKNFVGMPSVAGWNNTGIRFKPELKTVVDMYFYHQLYEQFGPPGVMTDYCIGQRYHDASISRNQVNNHDADVQYLIKQGLILK